ncbi:MAG: CoA transferase, partial [Myxococcota bacterium]
AAPHGVYPCRGEDRWLALAIHSDAEWRLLRREMKDPPFGQDPRFDTRAGRLEHADELDEQLGRFTAQHDAAELMTRLQEAGLEAGVLQRMDELLEDPQLAHREHFQRRRHVHLGELAFENYAIRLAESPPVIATPGPNLGEHTEEVLCGMLGLAPEEVARMVAEEILV